MKINGGLGNQMLQYAAARALSLERNTELRLDNYQLDFRIFSTDETPRNYVLSVFPALAGVKLLQLPLVEMVAPFPRLRRQVYLSYAKRCFPGSGLRCFDGYRTDDIGGFFQLPRNTYLTGHFFSERFFKPYAEEIRKDFAFPLIVSERNDLLTKNIERTNSVSVHVRRTDYLHASGVNLSSVCDSAYYQRAIDHFEQLPGDPPHYFVFSDEPKWAAANLPLPAGRFTVIDHNTGGWAFEDMRLMSRCHHNVIANSTFSWWGAWLNVGADKIVVAPKSWYNTYTGPSEDLIVPEGWLRL